MKIHLFPPDEFQGIDLSVRDVVRPACVGKKGKIIIERGGEKKRKRKDQNKKIANPYDYINEE